MQSIYINDNHTYVNFTLLCYCFLQVILTITEQGNNHYIKDWKVKNL